MDKVYNHKDVEDRIYKDWEEKGYFKPETNPTGKPYCIILPPPNANGDLHFGHTMFTVEDILIRYHRMKGFSALWLPGTDHAGIETQYVFEKKLRKEGKSRLDYTREELYKMISDFVNASRGKIENQLRKLGFSLDWTREKYTLDQDIVKIVYKTFKKMFDDGLVYRAKKLVNYCTIDGTSFSDLEVVHEEKPSPLYYIKYGPLILATTRPETKFGDTAVAVHPDDKRYQKYVGKALEIETVLGKAKIKVIADESVDPNFGTGVVKITPAHDFNDFEVGKRHNLEVKQVIDFNGKMNELTGKFAGMKIMEARKAIVEEMKKKGLIEKIDENYVARIGLCYKCKSVLEPLPLEQWFVKVESLKKAAIEIIKAGKIKLFPKRFEHPYFQWLENLRDWNISRQIVWGIRIPAWKNKQTGEWVVTEGEAPKGEKWEQDPDTFDTWFSSAQWPFATLMANCNCKDSNGFFDKFYPTSVMETGYDILKAWVSRMVMMGIYITGKVPFYDVILHGLVLDPQGKKMSKSKGNVVNPLEVVDQYGADALRMALAYGTALGNDQLLSYSKLQAMRNFTNKLWNIARFINMQFQTTFKDTTVAFYDKEMKIEEEDKKIISELNILIVDVTNALDSYRFNDGAEKLYEFTWHVLADKYIEQIKGRLKNGDNNALSVLRHVLLNILKLLHPFMPFITEDIWGKMPKMSDKALIISPWPKAN